MGFCCRKLLMMLVVMVFALLLVEQTVAQSADCAADLTSCADSLNSTKPPQSCCQPLKTAVETKGDCLCGLYNNRDLLTSLGVNVTKAEELPKYCGITTLLNCKNGRSHPTSSSPPTSPTKGTPSGASGSGSSSSSSSAGKMTLTGISSLLLLSVLLNTY